MARLSSPRIDRRWWLALVAVGIVIVAPIAWWLGSPLVVNHTVNERFPVVAPATAATPAAGQPAASEPAPLSAGQFNEIDSIHKGAGTATVYTLPDGQRVLRFTEFRVTNGPDLFVYLSGHADPRSSPQVHEGAAVELGRLKGNLGDQNYALPAGLDLASIKSVVIYCKQFSVVFSTASLMPLGPDPQAGRHGRG